MAAVRESGCPMFEPSLDRDELLAMLRAERDVWVRYVIDAAHEVRALEVSVHYAPPSWESRNWRYAQASFGAERASGAELFSWITGSKASRAFPEARFDDLAWPAN